MKELFNKALINLNKNKQVWIVAVISFTLIMTIGMSLSYLLGMFNILLLFFVACPFIFSFINISFKNINNEELELKDVYSGYKNLSSNLAFTLSKLIKPMFFFLLIYFIIYLIVAFIDLMFFNYDLIEQLIIKVNQGLSSEELTSYLIYNSDYLNRVKVANYIAMGITFILLNIFMNKKILLLAYYNRVNNRNIKYEFIIKNNKEFNKYKLLLVDLAFSLFIVVALILALLIYNLLSINIENMLLPYLLSSLIFYIVYNIGTPVKYSFYIELFNEIFEKDAQVLKNIKD